MERPRPRYPVHMPCNACDACAMSADPCHHKRPCLVKYTVFVDYTIHTVILVPEGGSSGYFAGKGPWLGLNLVLRSGV
jgi:hypothetical protein